MLSILSQLHLQQDNRSKKSRKVGSFQFFPSCILIEVVYIFLKYFSFQFFPSCIFNNTSYSDCVCA
ncbi:MAG: hypothetical protein NZ954_08715 [Thermofilaceae archaeon]|nr:hypothetical protein [Thermofilaceae archaeon]